MSFAFSTNNKSIVFGVFCNDYHFFFFFFFFFRPGHATETCASSAPRVLLEDELTRTTRRLGACHCLHEFSGSMERLEQVPASSPTRLIVAPQLHDKNADDLLISTRTPLRPLQGCTEAA